MKLTVILLITSLGITVNGDFISGVYLKYFKQKAIEIIDKAGRKDDCSRHLKSLIADLFNIKKTWALKMLDASSKLQSGFLTGNIYQMGNFDQCISIYEDKGDEGIIEGQYCTIAITPIKNSTSDVAQVFDFVTSVPEILGVKGSIELKNILKLIKALFGVCLPKSCNADNIQKIWNYVEHTFRSPLRITFSDHLCSYRGKVPQVYDFDKYVFLAFGIYFCFIFLCSAYDLLLHRHLGDPNNNVWGNALVAFSIPRNFGHILDKPRPADDINFNCVSGLKVLSMFWVIYGHRFLFNYVAGCLNAFDIFEWKRTLISLTVLAAPFSVDTFLVTSGMLLAYRYMQIKDALPSKKPFPYFMFYFFRFLRLWPGLLASLLICLSVLKYLNDGPFWTIAMYKGANSCRHTWWGTALFMTNVIPFHIQCMEPTWYLAVDTQLYCIAPFILIYMYKYPKRTTLVCLGVCIVSGLYAYAITVRDKHKWLAADGDDEFYNKIYQATFIRMPPWMLGVFTGVLLHKYRQIRIPKAFNVFLWITTTGCLLGPLLTNHILVLYPYNEYTSGAFNALARPVWGMAICLIIFLCATGHGGIVNDFLSLEIFQILVRMSYGVYLVHLSVITLIGGAKRSATYFSNFLTFHAFLGDLLFVFAIAFIWCLVFESPFISLGKYLINFNSDFQNSNEYKKKKI